ncbi:MAG: YigZ family protein [Paludibacter sp.]|nr:YigZ family protein [Paludibacter sp.]
MSDIYKTITTTFKGIYKEKGSKFLSFAIPVSTVEEVKEFVKNHRKDYYDARHVCYAYMLGADRNDFRTNDDGEPGGTAGRPILGQINSRELTNVLVIVVRYFGGVLLGTGGLTTAYKEAAADALNLAAIIEKTVDVIITIHFDYVQTNEVMHIIKDSNARIIEQSFENLCVIQLSIPKQNENQFTSKLNKIMGLVIKMEQI